jgi:hypothetical protein
LAEAEPRVLIGMKLLADLSAPDLIELEKNSRYRRFSAGE